MRLVTGELEKIEEIWRRWGGIVAPAGLLLTGALLILPTHDGLAAPVSLFSVILEILFHALLISWLFWFFVRARLSSQSKILWLIALAFCVYYTMRTDAFSRSYDAQGHRDYVEIIARRHFLPHPKDCWVCYHPPVYYLAAAPFYAVFLATPHFAAAEELHILSAYLFAFLLIVFFRMSERYIPDPRDQLTAFALMAALPTSIMFGCRIGNDSLTYILWIIAVERTALWESSGARNDLWIAAGALALGCLTKMSIACPMSAVGLAVLTVFVEKPERRAEILRQAWLPAVVVAVTLVAYVAWSRSFISQGVTGNTEGLPAELRMHLKVWSVFVLNMKPYLTEYANLWQNSGGREYFWNLWLKTALVGGWSLLYPGGRLLMSILSAALLPVLFVFGLMTLRLGRESGGLPSVLTWSVMMSPVFNFLYLWHGGWASMGEARYVYPFVPVATILYARLVGIARVTGHERLALWADGAGLLFIAAGMAFLTSLFLNFSY